MGDKTGTVEEWALVIREQLREQACTMLRQLTDQDRWADADKACGYARRWVELDPLSEEAHRRTMALLARTGQRAAALTQFERCRELLRAELDITPEPETVALYEELKQSVAPIRLRPAKLPGKALPLPPTRLIGRTRELAALNEREQITHDPEDIEEFEVHVAAVRAALHATAFERAWAGGQTLSLEQAVGLALDEVAR